MPSTSLKPGLKLHALILCAATLALAWQFFHPGLYYKIIDHAIMVPKYVYQFEGAFRQGILYPRWMPEDFMGYGSPAFVFYSPVFYYLSCLLYMASSNLSFSVTLVDLLALYAGGACVYAFMKDSFGERPALVAALCYTLLPDRFVEFYYTNTPSGRVAMAFMALVMLTTRKFIREPFSRRNLAGMGFSYAALVLTHLATAYIFTPFVVAYGLLGIKDKPDVQAAIRVSAGILAGLCLCSFFFLPVVFERAYVHIEHFSRSPDYAYWFNFVFNNRRSRIEDLQRLLDITRDSVIAEAALTAGFYYLARRYAGLRLNREPRFFIVSGAVCIFMTSFLSAPIWKHVPGLTDIAFPFRFISIYLLFLSGFIGIIASRFFGWSNRPKALTALAAAVAVSLLAYNALIVLRSGPVSEAVAAGYARGFDYTEYLPANVDLDIVAGLKRDDPALSSQDKYSAKIIKWGDIDRSFTVESPDGVRLKVKTFYFPGWKGWVDGAGTELSPDERTGAIVMNLQPGRHQVRLRFTDTPVRKLGVLLSIFTFAALLVPYKRSAA